jgi:hypothetical protein
VAGGARTPLAITLTIDIDGIDYSYVDTKVELQKVLFFRSISDMIMTTSYYLTELIVDSSVDGIKLEADATGFSFRSKYFKNSTKAENYKTLLMLYNERYISLKRNYFTWTFDNVLPNSVGVEQYNFFIHTQEQE